MVALSKDTVEEAHTHRERDGLSLTLLADPQLDVIRLYGVEHHKSLNFKTGRFMIGSIPLSLAPSFKAMAIPTSLLVDEGGIIRWIDQSEDYRGGEAGAGGGPGALHGLRQGGARVDPLAQGVDARPRLAREEPPPLPRRRPPCGGVSGRAGAAGLGGRGWWSRAGSGSEVVRLGGRGGRSKAGESGVVRLEGWWEVEG